MIEILNVGKISRIKIHFTCEWCGCQFAADKADYVKRFVGNRLNNIDEYEYRTTCPICGGSIWAKENEIEKWRYTDYGDGTESMIRLDNKQS